MGERVTFIGTFRIPDGGFEAWTAAIADMRSFVESHVPGVISFNAYVNEDGSEGTVVYVHPNADSLDQHLAAAASRIEAGSQMVTVLRIELLGSPHAATVEALRASGMPVTV
ncbi:MAG TPA: hypothetical protein VFH90_07875, partial [Candidatus Limnocylindria bacterium]|nr:hypothetical protein [Candidatus Limnocylindria bacterium]